MMNLIVNGKELKTKKNSTVGMLLKELGIEDKVMATAVNMEVVKKEDWDRFTLKEGDRVEFLHFVGGG
jgi:sulfur carrier protein